MTKRAFEVEHLGKLDELSFPDREIAHRPDWIEVRREPLEPMQRGLYPRAPSVLQPGGIRKRREQVFQDRQRRHQRELLEHHADAAGHGLARRCEAHGAAVHADLARVGVIEAVEHFHQSAFAGAVFAQQRQHLAGANFKINIVVRGHGAELLTDAGHGDKGG